MKYIKILIVVLLIIIVVILPGCIGGNAMLESRLEMLNNNPYENAPKERMTTIAEAIANEDNRAIYNMFSQTAKDNGVSDESISTLINFLKGSIDSLEFDGVANETMENNYGTKKIWLAYHGLISVFDNVYVLSVKDCVGDDTGGENLGLMRLVVFPADIESFPDVPDTGVYVIK